MVWNYTSYTFFDILSSYVNIHSSFFLGRANIFYRTQVSLVRSMGPSVSETLCLTHTPFADFTDVTLADENTNSILIDNANRAIQGNVAMQVAPSGGKSCN